MGYKSSTRGAYPVRLIAIHSAQGARTARALGNYFWRNDVMASSHVGIDAVETLQYVPYERAAWTLRSGNPISDNAEMCAFAEWTRAEWLSTGVVDGCLNPRQIVRNTALWTRSRALARSIPLQRLTPIQVAQGNWGLIDHYAWTVGMKDGTHTDVGKNFPWDIFMADVTEEDDVAKPFQNIMLAREKQGEPGSSWPKVYAGDGITRRHVANERDLENLQFRIDQAGGNPEVQEDWAAGTLAGVLGVEIREAPPAEGGKA